MPDDQDTLWSAEPPAGDDAGQPQGGAPDGDAVRSARPGTGSDEELPWPQAGRAQAGDDWAPIERGGAASWYAEETAPDEPARGRQRAGGGGRETRKRRARRRLAVLIAVVLIALLVGVAIGIVRSYFSTGPVGPVVKVTIPEGATLNDIADRLAAKRVVKHARVFVFKAQGDGYADKFRPGTYKLHVNEPYDKLVALLLKGTAPPTVDVTLPEGLTVQEQAAKIKAALPSFKADEFVRIATKDPPPVKLEGYKAGTMLEGMLFPATYNVRAKVTPSAFMDLQLAALKANLAKVDMTRARKANLTSYDVLIIASLVEGEALVADERPLVAAVIWNRLHDGMLLQIDAAIQYALGERKPALTYQDYKIDSPYNVYKYFGLPPTPIDSPGLAAMQAAANPAHVDYLYYVARADGSGRHYWSNNYDQFLKDKAKAAQNAQQ